MAVKRAQAWLPAAWAMVLALVLLGPALAPGYVLTYDMVWVPDLAVRPDVWGLGSALPRAVPSDAVVALLDELVPGAVLQKVLLLAALVSGGAGAARLVPGAPEANRAGQMVAVSAYVWTPFVAERLLLGSWPVVVAHGLLPWLVLHGRSWRRTGRVPVVLLVLVPLGCLSAGAGLATTVVLLAAVWGRRSTTTGALVLLVAANAPWWVSGLLHAASATTDRASAAAFALQGHGALPTPLEALVLGGTWNSEVVLPSRDGALTWVGLGLLVAALLTLRGWWVVTGTREALSLVVPWAVGLSLALLTWAAPGVVAWLVSTVPGGGLVRDGARSLVTCAPLVAVLLGHAAGRLTSKVVDEGPRLVLAGALAIVPVMLMPDGAFGLTSRLAAVDYPSSYAAARAAVAGTSGDALVLPLTSYRQPTWNGRRSVLDPMPRWLTSDVVASDRLVVGTASLQGEDLRVRAVEVALASVTPQARADALERLGFGAVVLERDAGPVPAVAGRTVLEAEAVTVVALDDAEARPTSAVRRVAAGLAWTSYGAGPVLGLLLAGLRRRTGRARRDS